MNKASVSLRLDSGDFARVEKIAFARQVSPADVIREVLAEWDGGLRRAPVRRKPGRPPREDELAGFREFMKTRAVGDRTVSTALSTVRRVARELGRPADQLDAAAFQTWLATANSSVRYGQWIARAYAQWKASGIGALGDSMSAETGFDEAQF